MLTTGFLAIWEELGFPVGQPAPRLADSSSHFGFLPRRLGFIAGYSYPLQQDSYVVASRVCRRSWCTEVVSGG